MATRRVLNSPGFAKCGSRRWGKACRVKGSAIARRPLALSSSRFLASWRRAGARTRIWKATGPAARRAADAVRARGERRPRVHAQLPRMAFGRGPNRTWLGAGLRRGRQQARRPPAADPHPFSGRLGHRRDRYGQADLCAKGLPGRRRRQDRDAELRRNRAAMPRRARDSNHRRRDLRVRLRAGARRRR